MRLTANSRRQWAWRLPLAVVLCLSVGCETERAAAPLAPPAATGSATAVSIGNTTGHHDGEVASADEASPAAVERIVRPADPRPRRDPQQAEQLGIRRYVSRRLELFSDIEPERAAVLPAIIDQAYDFWEEYFGELPPAADGSDWQATGYLMAETDRFLAAGMIPEDLPPVQSGQHRGREFWMRDVESDYYRRHLLIHEATHCYMTVMPREWPPLWYLEGIAELFATHVIDAAGNVSFAVVPESPQQFPGLGRIETLQREIRAGRELSIAEVRELDAAAFAGSRLTPYAWTWALCQFLDATPRCCRRFRELGDASGIADFDRRFQSAFSRSNVRLSFEWSEFVRRVDYGYDFARNETSTAQRGTRPGVWQVTADRGWQITGMRVEEGQSYELTAEGDVQLGDHPRPWVSLPDGISIRYAAGEPIGRLLSGILHDDDDALDQTAAVFSRTGSGASQRFTAERSGILCLRINDFGGELADNIGVYEVHVRTGNH